MLEAHSRLRTTKVSANLALPEGPASLFRRPYSLDGHRKTRRTPPIQRFQAGRPAKAPPNSRLELEIDDERQVVGGRPRQFPPTAVGSPNLDRTVDEHAIESSKGTVGREREDAASRSAVFRGFEDARTKPSPHVVEIASEQDGRVTPHAPLVLPSENSSELTTTLELREPEVNVEHPDVLVPTPIRHVEASVQSPPSLLERYGEIDVLIVVHGEATEQRVPVVSLPQPDVRRVDAMRKLERVADEVDLPVLPRARDAFVDFLEEDEIRRTGVEDVDDPVPDDTVGRCPRCLCGCCT